MKHLFVMLVLLLTLAPVSNATTYADEVDWSRVVLEFRNAATKAVEDHRFNDLAQIEKDIMAFRDSSGYGKPVFRDVEVIMMKFLERDFAFVANPDSIAAYLSNSLFVDKLYSELLKCIKEMNAAGKLEEELLKIENASDRAFVRVIMARLMNVDQNQLTQMIDRLAKDLDKDEQLKFLVHRFWKKEGYDYGNYTSYSVGFQFNVPIGSFWNDIDCGKGAIIDVGIVYKLFMFGMQVFGAFHDIPNQDSYEIVSGGLEFYLGAAPNVSTGMILKPYAGFGVQMASLFDKGESGTIKDQATVMIDVGIAYDFTVLENLSSSYAIRLRTGIKSLLIDDLLESSGFVFYANIEIAKLQVKYKKFEFDYAKARDK